MKIAFSVLSGPVSKKKFVFEEPGGFTFGRAKDCTCVIPEDDNSFSRHHFLIEITPPNVTLKDLGSLNGTFVNGDKHGGRAMGSQPEDGEISPALSLRDGDRIKAGVCELELTIDTPAVCVDCGEDIARDDRKAAEFVAGTYVCQPCRTKEEQRKRGKKAAAGKGLNLELRRLAEENAAGVVELLLREIIGNKEEERPPAIQGYTDMKRIGVGGFGAVYRTTRKRDSRLVAVKTMLQTRKPPKRHLLMFEREKEIALQLKHPNVVHCEKAGQWKDIHFMEMEYMPGGSVDQFLKKPGDKLPLSEVAPIMLQCLEGLAYANGAEVTLTFKDGRRTVQGVVHRDLKPSNILLAGSPGNWTAKLSDFGLSKAFSEAGMTKGAITTDPTKWLGTVPYMAPEHFTDFMHVGPATDVFEMAATFYHMLTGRTVWSMRVGINPMKMALEQEVQPIQSVEPGIPKALAVVFEQALAREKSERYADGGAFLKAMEHVL
jgi:hypothetical protein